MKQILITLSILVACSVALAVEPIRLQAVTVTTGTNAAGTNATSALYGYVDEVSFALPSGTAVTGTVTVTCTQKSGASFTLASSTIAANTIIRPRFDGTTAAGAANTSDAPDKYLTWADSISCVVSAANTTGLSWVVYFKTSDK